MNNIMIMPDAIDESLLAPCGVNCLACYAHVRARNRRKHPCPGCQSPEQEKKPPSCLTCRIKTCADSRDLTHCFSCADFPCKLIKDMDRRYRTGYSVSLLENGRVARESGVTAFLAGDRIRWSCSCGGVVNQHDHICTECGQRHE